MKYLIGVIMVVGFLSAGGGFIGVDTTGCDSLNNILYRIGETTPIPNLPYKDIYASPKSTFHYVTTEQEIKFRFIPGRVEYFDSCRVEYNTVVHDTTFLKYTYPPSKFQRIIPPRLEINVNGQKYYIELRGK